MVGAGHVSPTERYLERIGVRPSPRATCPFDPGYDPVTVEAHLQQSAHLIGTLKISMACWMVAEEGATRRKIQAARSHGIPTVAGGGPLAALLQSVAGHDEAAQMLRTFITENLVGPIVATVAPDAPALRGALVASQLVGLGLARYVLQLEPLASADRATVVAAVAPNLQRYLTGPLDVS